MLTKFRAHRDKNRLSLLLRAFDQYSQDHGPIAQFLKGEKVDAKDITLELNDISDGVPEFMDEINEAKVLLGKVQTN